MRKSGLSDLKGEPIPSDPEEVQLAVPIERTDLTKGWVALEIPEEELDEEGEKKRKAGKTRRSVINESPIGAGLRDGATLAFRFRGESGGEEDEEVEWDVVIPSYDYEEGG